MTFMEQMQSASAALNSPWAPIIAGGVLEAILRMVKTKEPKSLMYMVANGLKLVAEIMIKISQLMDKVLQRVDEAPPQVQDNKQT